MPVLNTWGTSRFRVHCHTLKPEPNRRLPFDSLALWTLTVLSDCLCYPLNVCLIRCLFVVLRRLLFVHWICFYLTDCVILPCYCCFHNVCRFRCMFFLLFFCVLWFDDFCCSLYLLLFSYGFILCSCSCVFFVVLFMFLMFFVFWFCSSFVFF